ncbi:unnamed protein product [Moneuplotes crassus]|uniref:Uncharacterized protein n=1 Tax=Euplotes crassus TaxID=5936 RepID=A0AAD1U578_EUPCR|nr:unnamed protein product [Moneuplotes crassus]
MSAEFSDKENLNTLNCAISTASSQRQRRRYTKKRGLKWIETSSKGSIQSRVELQKVIKEAYDFLDQPDEVYEPPEANIFNLTNQKYDVYSLERKKEDLPKIETVEEFVKKRIERSQSIEKQSDHHSFYSRHNYHMKQQETVNQEGKVPELPSSHIDTAKLGLEDIPKLPKSQYTEASCGCFSSSDRKVEEPSADHVSSCILILGREKDNLIHEIMLKSLPETPTEEDMAKEDTEEDVAEEENARNTSCYAFPRVRSISKNKIRIRDQKGSCGPKLKFDNKCLKKCRSNFQNSPSKAKEGIRSLSEREVISNEAE